MKTNVVAIAAADRRLFLAERDRLVETHLDLVSQIALSLAQKLPDGFDVEELAGAGNLGLLRAATVYRARPGVPFGAYARKVITGFMLDSIRRRNYLYVSLRADSDAERFLALAVRLDDELDRRRVAAAIDELPWRLRSAIHLCYVEGKSVATAAREMGVTPQRMRSLHDRAIRVLQLKFLVA